MFFKVSILTNPCIQSIRLTPLNVTIMSMARASASSTETEKKAPRKRVSEAAVRAAAISGDSEVRRKAPTSLDSSSQSSRKSYKIIYIPALILVLGLGISAFIGFSDEGQINIVGVINDRNTKVSAGEAVEGESGTSQIVPVQNNGNGLPDGGLVGAGTPPPPAPVEEVASTTLDGSDATSTEPVAEEVPSEETPN